MVFNLRLKGTGVVLIVLSLLSTGLLYASSSAQNADNRISIGISPQLLDITANPGELQNTTFRLTNASEGTIALKTIPKNFLPRGEEGSIDLTEDQTSFSLADWITVTPEQADIAPSKTQDFRVAINVPENAEPGSHFGSVVFQTIPPESDTSAALVSQEVAPIILVRIAGNTNESVEIEEFKTSKSTYSNQSNVELFSRLKNTGSVHFKPAGQIVIKNMFGNEVTKLDLERKNVLPDSIRQITTNWSLDGFKLGWYTAELTVVFGENDEIRTAKTNFVIFPYQIVLPVIAVLAILGFLAYKGRRRLLMAAKALGGKEVKKD